jgi:tetratricopeptide (TPR) repeat protein
MALQKNLELERTRLGSRLVPSARSLRASTACTVSPLNAAAGAYDNGCQVLVIALKPVLKSPRRRRATYAGPGTCEQPLTVVARGKNFLRLPFPLYPVVRRQTAKSIFGPGGLRASCPGRMSPMSPPSLLITPDHRRRLQQRYEEALVLAGQERPEFARVHSLLAECVTADPACGLYLGALLANLRRRDAARRSQSWPSRVRTWIVDRWFQRAPAVPRTEHSVLSTAPKLLWRDSKNVTVLRTLAEAASAHDFDEVELAYLVAAREVAPDDPQSQRMLARALTRHGRFEESLGPWFAVLAFVPDDPEATQAVEDLRGADELVATPTSEARPDVPSSPAHLVRIAKSMQDVGAYASAEQYLAQAQAAAGGDLTLWELREDLRLRQSEQRLAVARRRASHDTHPKAHALVGKFEQEHSRLHIEILNIRAERLPQAADVRIELARRLKQAGNFSGAIQRLEEVLLLTPDDPSALIELGECWQHLRQFAKALDFYEQAIAAADLDSPPSDDAKLAHYRAGVLAAAMGETERARSHLEAIVAIDAAFRDAQQRLDNLGPNRHN